MIMVAAYNSSAADKASADFVCDGVDDQAEINAAIASFNGNPGAVLLRSGDYNIGASTENAGIVIAQSNITLTGEGWSTRLRLQDNADVNMIRSVGDSLSNIVIKDMYLNGNSENNSFGETLEDRFEHNVIRIMPDSGTSAEFLHSDVWVTGVFAENANRINIMLGGNRMHIRDNQLGNAGSDVAEVLYGTGSDISDNVVNITGTVGYVLGSDAASGVSIRNNTTYIWAGGHVTEAVHRTWEGQYYNQIIGNAIYIEDGGIVNRAIEARGYANLISGNLIVAPGQTDDGRASVEVNSGSSIVDNYFVSVDIVVNSTANALQVFIDGNQGIDTGVPSSGSGIVIGNNVFSGVTTSSDAVVFEGTAGNDFFSSGAGLDRLSGGLGNDTLSGGRSSDVLDGEEGNDFIDGGQGVDIMIGGIGNDTFVVSQDNDVIVEYENEGFDTIRTALEADQLRNNVENLTYTGNTNFTGLGNTLNNVLTGGAGNDRLSGEGGNDTLNGSFGADMLSGGAGDDLYFVENEGDQVTELANGGVDEVRSALGSYTLSANVEDLLFIGTEDFAGTGNELDNRITGGAGNDMLIGGAGADILAGGSGIDAASYATAAAGVQLNLVTGGAAGDALGDQFVGIENIIGSGFSDHFVANAADNMLDGLDGDDVLTGLGGNDTLVGGEGNDILTGGTGADVLGGGNGFDTISYSSATSAIALDLDTGGTSGEALGDSFTGIERVLGSNGFGDEIRGSAQADQLRGLGGNDLLFGEAGDDIIGGDAGNDIIDGGEGSDMLSGGAGDDLYFVENEGDQVIELANGGVDEVRSALGSYTLSANVEDLLFIGTEDFAGTGNELDNRITGGAGNDMLIGGAGADILAGGSGIDAASYATAAAGVQLNLVTGGAAGDALGDQFVGIENIIGSGFSDHFVANAADNMLDGLDGDDVLTGLGGNDTLVGGEGNDILTGGTGADVLGGGNGFDTISYSSATSAIALDLDTGGTSGEALGDSFTGIERVLGSNGFGDEIRGSAQADQLRGLGGNDLLFGEAGDDIIGGDAGNDIIDGGEGSDMLSGGAGDDLYIFGLDSGADTIIDFEVSFDKIDVSAFGLTFAQLQANMSQDGNTGRINFGNNNYLDLQNVNISTLTAADFIIVSQGNDAKLVIAERSSPIILDGNGIETVSAPNSRAEFDIDGGGKADDTSWTGSTEGFLFLDRDGNGTVSNVGKMSFIKDIEGAPTDLAGLKAFDSNDDGARSSAGDRFTEFNIWRDRYGDRTVDAGEIVSLGDSSIESIALAGTAHNARTGISEMAIISTGTYTKIDGTTSLLAGVALTSIAKSKSMLTHGAEAAATLRATKQSGGMPLQIDLLHHGRSMLNIFDYYEQLDDQHIASPYLDNDGHAAHLDNASDTSLLRQTFNSPMPSADIESAPQFAHSPTDLTFRQLALMAQDMATFGAQTGENNRLLRDDRLARPTEFFA